MFPPFSGANLGMTISGSPQARDIARHLIERETLDAAEAAAQAAAFQRVSIGEGSRFTLKLPGRAT
jgi:hypothetical protein